METESLLPSNPTYYGGIKSNLRRRRYQRGSSGSGGRKTKVIRWLKRRPRKYWRIRTIPKLRWVIRSPLKMLTKLKNAYMNFMLRLAGNIGSLNTHNNIVVFGGKRIPKPRQFSMRFSGDAFEARLIYEISKTLVASHELNPM
ncbi:uncharacterized protein LOC107486925 [Arachis duranensis]|uniref:Uncharacterized protein LOC107486925 n=1 Tax=Arachis duranensis TaxID=130453 RepID=A0A6P4DCT1_ARADU|nr:uncharacterized protein LOC107486925 [Arachis duranensis]